MYTLSKQLSGNIIVTHFCSCWEMTILGKIVTILYQFLKGVNIDLILIFQEFYYDI